MSFFDDFDHPPMSGLRAINRVPEPGGPSSMAELEIELKRQLEEALTDEMTRMGPSVTDNFNRSLGPTLDALGIGPIRITIDPQITVEFE